MEEIESGVLYIVATPIGNLADISYRAVHILKNVALIAAEDTRKSAILMQHYGIMNKVSSYHSYNLKKETPRLVSKLLAGNSVALISDAGTPGISDPGYHLVRSCLEENIRVIPIPGASAFLAALTVSGMPTHSFVFEGFLPVKKGRKTKLQQLESEKRTVIFYESPHRIKKTIIELKEVWGNRECVMARELTKKFEEIYRGNFDSLLKHLGEKKVKGEIVLIVQGKEIKKGR